ncbi:glycoside hydrolase family 16 protein [Polaribacter batillariae]|uniref:Glycoside hydrolase family 16 protein n=1 Tax=Polaribacter batillariae TaxID=2808900 RepID=A0ABX7SYA8_9FLAO|nr:glycoside hydrolase family 16 protein [Polaribacter batillariae]QTD38483.1 glycoside hydrolase family 16 protein [Polaribacter batillariae]
MKNIIKLKISYILILSLLVVLQSCDTDETQVVTRLSNLVMQDEFDTNGSLNPSVWNFEEGTGENGWGNNELQYYTSRPENATVQNGYLIITAKREDFKGSQYTSARITTKGKFEQKYGRFEAKIKLPSGQGMWPAFWLLGNDCETNIWPNCGEIDIMENRGQEPTKIAGSVHGPGYSAGQAITKDYVLDNDRFDSGFHVFGIEWGEDYINYYVDDVLYNQITREDVTGDWVFDHPFYIILNLAVGGNYVGSPNNETEFPQTMLVDYVKVYQ